MIELKAPLGLLKAEPTKLSRTKITPLLIAVAALLVGLGSLLAAFGGRPRIFQAKPLRELDPYFLSHKVHQSGTAGKEPPIPEPRQNYHHRVPQGGIVTAAHGGAKISMPIYASHAMREALGKSPKLHGLVNKVGVTPPKYWHHSREEHLIKEWWRWGNNTLDSLFKGYPTNPGVPPPGCQVFINHLYRYIYIRNIFSSGNFFEEVLGGECLNRLGDKPTCGNILANEHANMDEERARKLWQDYFVFTVASNPWKRAVSVYNFLQAYPPKHHSGCSTPPWSVFVKDPNVFGRQCEFSGCCRIPENPTFEHQLVMSDARCITNLGHQSAADFILREDHMEEDLPVLVEHLNKYAHSSADEIVLKEVPPHEPSPYRSRGHHEKMTWYWDEQWVGMYTEDDAKSFTFIAMYYADDIKFFQYPLPAAMSTPVDKALDDDNSHTASHRSSFCSGANGQRYTTQVQSAKVKW
mmetsp:Transcript_23922/g.66396  ORF Transcript_23922/g.66396 Transcript_23922/m.66396 type:complete len:466 (+) Transcript_23922:314-1711(+)